MIPWTLLGSAPIPGEADEIRLYQRGTEYSIRVGHYELMNNRVHGSEDALGGLSDRARDALTAAGFARFEDTASGFRARR